MEVKYKYHVQLYIYIYVKWAADDVVGIATCYRLDDPGIESQWGQNLPHPSRPALGHIQASYTMGIGSFLGVKQLGRGVDHPPPSSAEVKERVVLYLTLSGPSLPVLGRTVLYFTLYIYI